MRNVVYTILGYKPVRGVKTTESGEPSTDEESLELLRAFGEASKAPSTGSYILDCIIACRKFHKVIEILNTPIYPDGRFRFEFNLAGAETGRSTSSETTDRYLYFDGNKVESANLGHSIQNIGKHGFQVDGITYGRDIRSIFRPSRGFTFVEGDGSQAEARVDAILSGLEDLSFFEDPGIHKLTGSWLYGCPPQEIKKNILIDGVDRYHMSKTVRHAGERNMTPGRLRMMTQRPIKECEQILDKFHKFQPEIRQVFHKDVIKFIQLYPHCLVAPNGRRRDFYDRIDNSSKNTFNEGISFIPQAIVTDQTKFCGILRTYEDPEIYRWAALLAEAHDGCLNEVRIGREKDWAQIYKKNFEIPIDFRKCTLVREVDLVIPCEFASGEDWTTMEDFKI